MIDSTLGYYRQPAICGDDLIFVCETDLWRVPMTGGEAQRLTANRVECVMPVVSPDQQSIVYAAQEEGVTELYRVAAGGGHPERLTYLGGRTYPVGHDRDGKIVFCTNSEMSFSRDSQLMTLTDGVPEILPFGSAVYGAFDSEGRVAIMRNTVDYARWKRYRGGRVGEMWVDAKGKGHFERLLAGLGGNICYPLWCHDRLYFLSDHEGHGNLYSCNDTGDDVRRETHHEDFYVRAPSTDGKVIAYQCGGDLWTFDPKKSVTKKVDVRVHSHKPQLTRRFVNPGRYLHASALSNDGEKLAIVSRGQGFVMPTWEGPVRHWGTTDGVRYRFADFLRDGERLVTLSDETGEETIEIHGPRQEDGTWPEPKRFTDLNIGRILQWTVCKDQLAATNQRGDVLHVDLQTGKMKVLDKSSFNEASDPQFSPDGEWVAYCASKKTHQLRQIFLANIESGEVYPVTDEVGDSWSPAFDPTGRYLFFCSSRTYDPVYDRGRFGLGFPKNVQLFLVTLNEDVASPFAPGVKLPAADADPISIDPEGMPMRMCALPVGEGRYEKIRAAQGRVFYTEEPVSGFLDRSFFDRPSQQTLHCLKLEDKKSEKWFDEIKDFDLGAGGKKLLYLSHQRVRVLDVEKRPDAKERRPGKVSGWVDLRRVTVGVVPWQEWRQMYRELWRLQREHFWTTDLSQVDWDEVYERYRPLLDRIADRAEFSDFAWEVQGELGTSHAYEMGGDRTTPPPYRVGFLGADLRATEDGWRVARIPQGDSWAAKAHSPLAMPGRRVQVDDVICSIDGISIKPPMSPGHALTNKAKACVELGIKRKDKHLFVTVQTLADESALRYRDWVTTNRRLVQEKSQGQLGYLHVPNMGPHGYSEFFRYFPLETQYEGLIVDVRHNGGGHVSPFLLEKLATKRLGYRTTHHGQPTAKPWGSMAGPIVCLTDEHAGSDGDIFSHSFKMLGIGPLVGRRTWGGVVGIRMRNRLVDNTLVTQPEYSTWFSDVEFGVENYGTDPDIEVTNSPMDERDGFDRQLETAIETAMQKLAADPVMIPDFKKPPVVQRRPLNPN